MASNGRDRRNYRVPERKKPDFLFWVLRATAQDMRFRAGQRTAPTRYDDPNGYDVDSGYGFVDAVRALNAVKGQY
jgi:hypothetical protein